MDKLSIAGQDAIIIKNKKQFNEFYDKVIETIRLEDEHETLLRIMTDRIKINKNMLTPKEYPVFLLPHPKGETGAILPWYFINKDQVHEMFKILNLSDEDTKPEFTDRFSRER